MDIDEKKSRFGKKAHRLGWTEAPRVFSIVAKPQNASLSPAALQKYREIVPSAHHLFEPSAYEKYGQRFRPQSLFALPEPLVPPKRLIFISYCRLLPPREIANSFWANGMIGRGGGDRNCISKK
jgi:hypothetical protein